MAVGRAPATPAQTPTRWAGTALGHESSLPRGYFVDSANRSGMAFFTGRISLALHLLATSPAVGRSRSLANGLASDVRSVGQRGSPAVGGELSRWQFRPRQKRGAAVGKTKRGKGTKWMVLVDGEGLPLGVRLESASPHEVTLAEATLAEVKVPRAQGRPRQKPERVIADTAYDSDPLRKRCRERGIDLIVPYRENNQRRRYEDGRKLRRYKRRWIVERTNAWLGQFRRLLVRHEHLLCTYRAFFYLACLWITLRRYL